MKILWVNPSFLDYRVPVYKRLYELTNGDFYIVFSKRAVPLRVIEKMKNAIGDHAIVFDGEKVFDIGSVGGYSNKSLRIPITKNLYKTIRDVKADLVIAEGFFQWTPKAVRYCFLHKIPLFIAYERTKHTERNCPRWRWAYRQFIDRFTAGYLCNGKLTKEYLESIGVSRKKLFVGGMSADSKGLKIGVSNISDNEKQTLRNEFGINDQSLTYVYSGQLVERKGVIYLLNAWVNHIKTFPNDHLLIVGGGELYDDFIKQFGDIGSIHFTNAVDYDDIYQYYAIADVFIIPTLEDNWSLVVPEAMACGLPIACSIYNGCYPELCREGENGVLFDPLDESSLLKALSTFHQVDLKAYGQRSIKIEKNYNSDTVAQNIFDACSSVINYNNK